MARRRPRRRTRIDETTDKIVRPPRPAAPQRAMVVNEIPQFNQEGQPVSKRRGGDPEASEGDKGFSVLAIFGQKGGSGKTTTAISIAASLVESRHRVLLVDADPQGSASVWSASGAASYRDLPTVVSMGPGLHRPCQLPRLAELFDYVVVDCPSRREEIAGAVLQVADLAVLPCAPSAPDVWSLRESIEMLRQVQRANRALRARVLITRKIVGAAMSEETRDAIDSCGLPILSVRLGNRVAYQEALGRGEGLVQHSPRSTAAAEVRALMGELLALPK